MRSFSIRSQRTSRCGMNKTWHTGRSQVCQWFAKRILTLSVIHRLTRQHRIYLLYIWYKAPCRRWWRHLRVCPLTDQKYEPVKTFLLVIWTTIHALVYTFHLNLISLLPFPRYCGIFRLFLLCEKNLQHRRGRRQGRKPMETLLFMYRQKYIGNFLT